jgi:hypothetical protein
MGLALPGADAWRESDCDGVCLLPMQDTEYWSPFTQAYLSLPEWGTRSINDNQMIVSLRTPVTYDQWSATLVHVEPVGDAALDLFSIDTEGVSSSVCRA